MQTSQTRCSCIMNTAIELPLAKTAPCRRVHVPQPKRNVMQVTSPHMLDREFTSFVSEREREREREPCANCHGKCRMLLQPRLRNHESKVVRAQAEASNLDELEAHFDAAFHVCSLPLSLQSERRKKARLPLLRLLRSHSTAPGLAQASFLHFGSESRLESWLAAPQSFLKRTIAFALSWCRRSTL